MYHHLYTDNEIGQQEFGGYNVAGQIKFAQSKAYFDQQYETRARQIAEREVVLLDKLRVLRDVLGKNPKENEALKKKRRKGQEIVVATEPVAAAPRVYEFFDSSDEEEDKE
jgi:hypothetical protein